MGPEMHTFCNMYSCPYEMLNLTSIHHTCCRRCSTCRPSIAMHPSALRQWLWPYSICFLDVYPVCHGDGLTTKRSQPLWTSVHISDSDVWWILVRVSNLIPVIIIIIINGTNSLLWTLAFLRSHFHPSLSIADLIQFLSPILLASNVTQSFHLVFGLPCFRLPSIVISNSLFTTLFSSILCTCPALYRDNTFHVPISRSCCIW